MLGDRVSFCKDLPTLERVMDLTKDHENSFSLLILDDLMQPSSRSPLVADIFTSIAHHRSETCIYKINFYFVIHLYSSLLK